MSEERWVGKVYKAPEIPHGHKAPEMSHKDMIKYQDQMAKDEGVKQKGDGWVGKHASKDASKDAIDTDLLKSSAGKLTNFKMIPFNRAIPAGWRWANTFNVERNMESIKPIFVTGTKRYWLALKDGWKLGGSEYEFAIVKQDEGEIFENKLVVEDPSCKAPDVKLGNFKLHRFDDIIPSGWIWATSENVNQNMENAKSIFIAGTNYTKAGLADGWKMGGSAYNYAVTKKDGEEIFKYKLIVESEGAEARPVKKGEFDEHNNYCYAYLRSVGNNWMYDPDVVHPKIKERLLKRFDTFDIDGDEVMTLDEIKKWPERMRSLCNANDEQVEKMKAAIELFFVCHGVDPKHGCKREHYIENNRIFAEYERERIRQGLQPIIHVLAESYFDVLDSDHNGYITYSELQTMMMAFEVPIDAADSFFAVCDTNGDGKLEYDEMHIQFVKFWFSEYDPTLDHIFADKY